MSLLDTLRGAPAPAPNAPRSTGAPGAIESYFFRLNHPTRPLALWLKATVYAPLAGEPVAEAWLVWFDGERGRTLAHRDTVPFARARFSPRLEGVDVTVANFELRLAPDGFARGHVESVDGVARFDLTWTRPSDPVARPLTIVPRFLMRGPLPRNRPVTPLPWLRCAGTVTVPTGEVRVDGWDGMQGHNWGTAHPPEYAWGHCVFPGKDGEPTTVVEGASTRVVLAGRPSPLLSTMHIARGERVYRFDRVVDLWRQHATVTPGRWTLRIRGHDGEARLRLDGTGRPMACLGYRNPDGTSSYCLNTKLADALLEVWPARGPAFTCRSAHGGALEFLSGTPDPTLPVV